MHQIETDYVAQHGLADTRSLQPSGVEHACRLVMQIAQQRQRTESLSLEQSHCVMNMQ
jgi:hypothetical protein